MLYPSVLVPAGATVTDRTLAVAGVTWDLDDAGRQGGPSGENHPPDATLVSAASIVAFAEGLGANLDFVEATTLKKVKIWATKDPADPYEGGFDSALYRQDADEEVVRVDA